MRPVEKVRNALERAGSSTKGPDHNFMAQCPSHQDGRPSLHVTEGQDGRAALHCFAGCENTTIVADISLDWNDLFPDDGKQQKQDEWTPEAEYVYTDEDGNKVMKVIRFPDKRFRQQRWTGTRWEWGLDGITRPLYLLPDVKAAIARGDWVFVTEGEKDAIAVRNAGHTATCNSGGAGKWEPQYTESLKGANIIILADDDEPGRAHAQMVYNALYGKATNRIAVRLPAEGFKDISDHLAAGKSLNGDLRKAGPSAAEPPVPATRGALTASAFSARKTDRNLELVGPMFQRGMRTVLGAATGDGKTTLTMQAVRALTENTFFLDERWRPPTPGRALLVDLEQGETTVQRRLREAGLAESERVDILWEPSGIALDKREEDRALLRDLLREGNYDMVVLDPLYQMHLGPGNSEEVAADVMRHVDGMAREFNVSLVIPMHMRKPHPDAGMNITMHDIAGSTTWLRNAEFVLGLQIMYAGASRLHFFKDRVGNGPELRSFWWLDFDREGGYRRSFKEKKDRLKKDLRKLLQRDEGASKEELLEVEGAHEVLVQELIKRCHVNTDGRYRTKKWPGSVSVNQQSLMGDTS